MNAKLLLRLSLISVVTCSIIMLAGCGEPEPSVDGNLSIHIFRVGNPAILALTEDVVALNRALVSDENGWLPLLQVDLSKSDAIINEEEIKRYHWNSIGDYRQTIVLDDDIHEKFGYLTEPNSMSLENSYFVIALGGEPFVGGLVAHQPSALMRSSPTLYYSMTFFYGDQEFWAEGKMYKETDKYFQLQQAMGKPYKGAAVYFDELAPNMRLRLEQIGVLTEDDYWQSIKEFSGE